MINKIIFIFILLISLGCSRTKESHLLSIVDNEYTKVNFQNTLKPTNELNILDYLYYYNGAGVAVGDINNDGLVDVFFTCQPR